MSRKRSEKQKRATIEISHPYQTPLVSDTCTVGERGMHVVNERRERGNIAAAPENGSRFVEEVWETKIRVRIKRERGHSYSIAAGATDDRHVH